MLNVHKDCAEKEPLQIVGIWFSYLILSKQEAEKHDMDHVQFQVTSVDQIIRFLCSPSKFSNSPILVFSNFEFSFFKVYNQFHEWYCSYSALGIKSGACHQLHYKKQVHPHRFVFFL